MEDEQAPRDSTTKAALRQWLGPRREDRVRPWSVLLPPEASIRPCQLPRASSTFCSGFCSPTRPGDTGTLSQGNRLSLKPWLPGVASGKQTWMLAMTTAMVFAKEWEFKSSHVRRPLPWGAGGTTKEPADPLSLSSGSPGCLELTASLLIAPQRSVLAIWSPHPPWVL